MRIYVAHPECDMSEDIVVGIETAVEFRNFDHVHTSMEIRDINSLRAWSSRINCRRRFSVSSSCMKSRALPNSHRLFGT